MKTLYPSFESVIFEKKSHSAEEKPKGRQFGLHFTFGSIDEECYIRNPLYPVCAKFAMGCVIVEGDSLALFTALKIFQGALYPVYVTAYKISHFVGPKKPVL